MVCPQSLDDRTAVRIDDAQFHLFGIKDAEQLTIQANNPEQEEALEVVPVTYDGEPMEIGFNVSYLQDVLGVLDTEQVKLSVLDANSSAVIEGLGPDQSLYVVMPMRL